MVTHRWVLAVALAASSWLSVGQAWAQASEPAVQLRGRIERAQADARTARAEIAAQKAWLRTRGLPAVAMSRLEAHEAELKRRTDEYDREAADWKSAPTEDKQRKLAARLKGEDPQATAATPAPASTLPWGSPKSNRRMPAEDRRAWLRSLHREGGVALAQAGRRRGRW